MQLSCAAFRCDRGGCIAPKGGRCVNADGIAKHTAVLVLGGRCDVGPADAYCPPLPMRGNTADAVSVPVISANAEEKLTKPSERASRIWQVKLIYR